ncbi:LAME_0G03114g1_1 [Lachancea meyersii CBS 8951]|uniref:LAME_0G03114g1_1 n=1 Tax=Lachancea meyersii CBS 8951 TaxID=1266667 RepID=A0A1G4K6H1_9SACH|nr:LAME_0G03114g1_1 [Lachancea meyersii CBS 8951]
MYEISVDSKLIYILFIIIFITTKFNLNNHRDIATDQMRFLLPVIRVSSRYTLKHELLRRTSSTFPSYVTHDPKTTNMHSISDNNATINDLDKLNKAIEEFWKTSKRNSVKTPINESTTGQELKKILDTTAAKKRYYKNSKTYRTFVRWEIIRNIDNTTHTTKLFNSYKTDNAIVAQNESPNKDNLLGLLITDCLKTCDIDNAVDLYIWFYKNFANSGPSSHLADQILNAMAFSNPQNDDRMLIKFLQLMEFQKLENSTFEIKETQAIQLCGKAMSVVNEPLLTKKVLDYVYEVPYTESNAMRNAQVIAAYRIINEDYKKSNAAGVFYQWTTIKDHYTSSEKHDSRILYRIIKLFTKQTSYHFRCREIIAKLEPKFYVNDALLLPSIISFYTKTNDFKMASTIMSNISTHANEETRSTNLVSKFMLSTLLRMHLNFKDSKGVQNVLTQINRTTSGLSPADYQAIVLHLIKKNDEKNLLKAIKMTQGMKGKSALPSVATIIHHVATNGNKNELKSKAQVIIKNLLIYANALDKSHQNKLWDIVASVFVKSLTIYEHYSKKPNNMEDYRIAQQKAGTTTEFLRYLFIKSSTRKADQSSTDPFNMPNPNEIILKLNKFNKLVILRTIAKEARFAQRIDLFRWSVSEMIKCGMPMKEIELEWNTMEKHQVRRFAFTDKKTVTQNVSKHGLSSFKNVINKP